MSLELFNGDCLEIMKELPDKSIDCFICDLPYGCLSSPRATMKAGWRKLKEQGLMPPLRRESELQCSWDIKIDLEAFWKEVKRLAKNDDTPVIHFCTTKFGIELINSNPSWFRYDLVWDKGRGVSFLSANKMPMRSHEMIYVFAKKGSYYNRVDIKGDFKKWEKEPNSVRKNKVYTNEIVRLPEGGDGKRCALSVININQKASYQMKGKHPTEKPIELYKWLIERYCPVGGTLLDPTAGSCNSLFAARELGRKSIGIEKDEGFFTKASKRIESL